MEEIALIFILFILLVPIFLLIKYSSYSYRKKITDPNENIANGKISLESNVSNNPKILSISNKLVSLRNKIFIDDEHGQQLYMAKCEILSFFSYTYSIYKKQTLVACVRKKIFSFSQTWVVNCETLGNFLIQKRFFSPTRHYTIIGGEFDGATFSGNIWGLDFSLQKQARKIAQARSHLLSLRDRQTIELIGNSDKDELITAIVMSTLHIALKNERDERR